MGIFRKLGNWLTEKSDRFVRGGNDPEGGYYASAEDEQAYAAAGGEEMQDTAEQPVREPLDPFGRGEGEYGGRVPYRSRYDREREAQQAAQQMQNVSPEPFAGQAQPMQAQPMMGRAQPVGQAQPVMGQSQPVQQMQPMGQTQQAYGNVVPFPGMQHTADGTVYAHVEYVVLLRSRNECKDVIAYIKSNASVFLNMEFIASDSERQRCVDMLSGAAYTLGCALNKISPRGIYLISSPSVRVVLDPAMQKFTAAPEAQGYTQQRQGYENGFAVQQEPQNETQFSAGSPTTRFQAQAAQQTPTSFGSVMAGNATGMYQPVAAPGRFVNVQQ